MVFFIGLNDDVKTDISPLTCSMACSSLCPTTDRGGMLLSKKRCLMVKKTRNLKTIITKTSITLGGNEKAPVI